uniref:Uncharacterized protein n=1 Tax=Ditylum brightwellii TaxID=49249 RepID=A0A7S4RXT2_9STRA
MAPIATVGGTTTGDMYVPPIVPILESANVGFCKSVLVNVPSFACKLVIRSWNGSCTNKVRNKDENHKYNIYSFLFLHTLSYISLQAICLLSPNKYLQKKKLLYTKKHTHTHTHTRHEMLA